MTQPTRGFASIIILLVGLALVALGGGYYVLQNQDRDRTEVSGSTSPTTETSQAQNPIVGETKTSSTVVTGNYSSQAYLEGAPEIAANTEWKGTLVIPHDTVNKAGNADINWGDNQIDSGGELGQTGKVWSFGSTDRVIVSHTYAKPGTYQINVSLWVTTGQAPDGGQQGAMLSIKRSIVVN